MARRSPPTSIISSDFENFTTDLAMKVWNEMTVIPQFKDLSPKDYPALYETVQKALKPYWVKGARHV
jgi:hypothetical protein